VFFFVKILKIKLFYNSCLCNYGFSGEICERNDLLYEKIDKLEKLSFFLILFICITAFCLLFFVAFIIIILLLIFTIFFIIYIYKKNLKNFKIKTEIEKKLLGEKQLNFKLNEFLNLSDEDYKIKFSELTNLDNIGEGASSIVFKGNFLKLNQIVALKLFKSSLFENQNLLIEFKKELQLISKLKNQNIITFIGFVAENNKFGIILEFCENGTLKSYLNKNKNILNFKIKLKFLIDISRG
jgi:Ca2+/Na+ antiporter